MITLKHTLAFALLTVTLATPALSLEGKWTPEQVLELDRAMLQREGLQLPPERLWDPKRGTGLLAGAVNLNGCSGAFISGTGLVVTNHHCVFSLIAEHARPDRDLLAATQVKLRKSCPERGEAVCFVTDPAHRDPHLA